MKFGIAVILCLAGAVLLEAHSFFLGVTCLIYANNLGNPKL